MKITAIMSVYNEMFFLPLKMKWCKANDIDLYVCDNMSTDGTWEYLQENNIPSHRYDTNEMFSEKLMQEEIRKTLIKLNPDWVLYMGCDMFFDIPKDYNEYTYVSFFYYAPKNTGEERNNNPFLTYKHAVPCGEIKFLFKWNENIIFNGDDIIIEGEGMHRNTLALNYGDTKPKEEREDTKARKVKAWQNGDNGAFGSHYYTGSDLGWIWDKNNLVDMSLTDHWKTIEQIAKDCGL